MEIVLSETEITATLKDIVQKKFGVDVSNVAIRKHRFGETEYSTYGAVSLVFSVTPKATTTTPTHPDETTRRMDLQL